MYGPTCIFWANLTPVSPQVASGVSYVHQFVDMAAVEVPGREIGERGLRGLTSHLNPLGLFLRVSMPFIWRILSVFLRA